jgi:D-alanine--poly(phosphoribitol) ligase subunit 2
MTQPVIDRIAAYIETQLLVTYGEDFTAGTNLFESGIMDSFSYVQLINFLQSTFDITLGDDAILTNVMVSLQRMTDAVTAGLAKVS